MSNKSPYDILRRPIITERALNGQEFNQYTFEVALTANKQEIRQAVEKAFGVKVEDIRTVTTKGKQRRTRFGTGKKPDKKKAIITLAEGQALQFT